MTNQVVSNASSGLVFNNTYTANCSPKYINCIVAAEKEFTGLFSNSVTINLTFDEEAQGNSGNLASNSWPGWSVVSYAQLKAALPASDNLPATDPSGGHTWYVPEGYARMLGLSPGAPSVDDTVTLNSSYGWNFGQDVTNTVEHEISEGAMGRVGGLGDQNGVWSTMDLFRYSAPGVPDFTDGRDGKTTYFSIDGKTLSSIPYNNQYVNASTQNNMGDPADFAQSDVFGTGFPGETNGLSQTDISMMNALGWAAAPPLPPPPVPPTIAGTVGGQTVVLPNTIDPFAKVTVADTNVKPTDSATITLTDAAASNIPTDADGILAGVDLTKVGVGVYTLAAKDPTTLTTELDALVFYPAALAGSVTSETADFTLKVSNPTYATSATDSNTTVTIKAPPPAPPPPPTPVPHVPNNFAVLDNTTGVSSLTPGTPYTGPAAGITNELINITPHNLNISAITPNVYIHTGDGNDGINVSAAGGTNILDGEGGSNFLVGGSGDDTFFVNDQYATVPSWTTMVGFHAGDAATVWGVTKSDFNLTWVDGGGAAGYTGLTMYGTSANKPEVAITLTGMTVADMHNGTLAVQFGTVSSATGTPLNYMEISHL